ncbi:N-acetylglucosamine-6-phosphate deacetylase [Agrobacterium vitis]
MTRLTAVTGARIFDGSAWLEAHALLIKDGIVEGVVSRSQLPTGSTYIDFAGQLIVPGFVDLQVNGGGGVRFGDETSVEAIQAIAMAHAKFGTTKLLPTLITDIPEVTSRAIAGGRSALVSKIPGYLGLHLEGPHLSVARKGAHNPDFIRSMTDSDLQELRGSSQSVGVMLTTVAPENVTTEQVSSLVDSGVIVSIGHSNVTAEVALKYFEAGATMVTHLFNAMSQLGNREPGIVGGALNDGRVFAGLITDGFHVDPGAIKLALRAKAAPGQIFIVTDAMQTIGTKLKGFELNGRSIRRSGGRLTLDDGTLAGADIDMLSSVRFVHEVIGLPLEQSLSMASSVPAKAVGVDDRIGYLKPGYSADFVVLTDRLDHVETWIDGVQAARS